MATLSTLNPARKFHRFAGTVGWCATSAAIPYPRGHGRHLPAE